MPDDTLRGELLDFKILGSDMWGRGRVRTLHDGGELTIVGKLVGANVGDTVELDGQHQTHPRFGPQYAVKSCRVILPSDASGVVGWLAAKLPQVSSRRAEQLVERFGVQGLWDVLDKGNAAALTVVDGITLPRAEEIVAAYVTHRADRDRIVRFKGYGLTDNQVAKVVAKWGAEAEQKLSENPYALIEHVDGFGWERADAVALRMGLRRDEPARLCAGLMHAMTQATQSGHCFVTSGKLVALTSKNVCAISDEHAMRAALADLVRRNKLVQLETRVYLPKIADAEGQLAESFARRAQAGKAGAG